MHFTLIHLEKKPHSSWAWDFYNLACKYTKHLCSRAGQGQRSSWGGGKPFPCLSTSHLSPPLLFVRAAWRQGDRRSLFPWLTGLPSKSSFFSLRPRCSAVHRVQLGQGGGRTRCCPMQFPAALPDSGGGTCGQQNTSKSQGVKHCPGIQMAAKACCRPPTLPSMMGTPWRPGKGGKNSVDKPINSQALPGVLA